ncbi:rubrerythrin family protein [Alkaliphilus serpentinus]|uniref:Rubrerythrin n=1 Tax=Alkaliphilus serpentinus TaxID=1482731 RepID=A0A833HNV9_9FIRM|nr:rubrerythrin family protein [Alkaliphilus serpentinus]KAB3530021.1 rubrerythrin [Alkaliphilus serpentinus]
MNIKGTRTEQNLWNAFAGESQARNKYIFYGQKAEADGEVEIAKLFNDTALQEETHAKLIFNYLTGVKDSISNLRDASQGEFYEATTLYQEYDRVAREEGFEEIADFFKELQTIEADHERRYKEMIRKLVAKKS